MTHPVVAALRDRPPGARIALVVEGGGMRGAVSGGMALGARRARPARGVRRRVRLVGRHAQRDVAGQRARARRHPDVDRPGAGRRAHQPPPRAAARAGGRRPHARRGALRGALPRAVRRGPRGAHRAAPDRHRRRDRPRPSTSTARSPTRATLRLALRASAALPLLAGPPVELGGRRYIDAGLSAAIPFRAALADGATHVLVLRSRREGETATAPGRLAAALTGGALRRLSPALRTAFLTRAEREAEDEALLARHQADPALEPAILSVRPPPDSPGAGPARARRRARHGGPRGGTWRSARGPRGNVSAPEGEGVRNRGTDSSARGGSRRGSDASQVVVGAVGRRGGGAAP